MFRQKTDSQSRYSCVTYSNKIATTESWRVPVAIGLSVRAFQCPRSFRVFIRRTKTREGRQGRDVLGPQVVGQYWTRQQDAAAICERAHCERGVGIKFESHTERNVNSFLYEIHRSIHRNNLNSTARIEL